jgi:cell division septation protein DedD
VRVIPSSGRTAPDEATPTEEPSPSTTLEDQPSAPAPPANLWAPAPTPSPSTPSRPAGSEASSGGVQTPQPLDSEPVLPDSVSGAPAPADTLYRVRVPGAYENREEADAALRAVVDKGLPGAVVTDTAGGRKVFRVQLGVYRNKSSAEKLAEQARRLGVRAEVSAPSP